MQGRNLVLAIIAGVIGVVAYSSMFTVHQAGQALVLQFGEPIREIREPGLNFKTPFVQDVQFFDKRVIDFDAQPQEVPTRDQKQLVVDAFARYRIVDPLLFYQTVNNTFGMENRLGNVINSNLRAVFGEVELARLLTKERSDLMHIIRDRVNIEGKAYGIDVIDVRIKHVDLPENNSQAIFRRMQTQREQEARKIRAEGEANAKKIRADADKQKTIIVANADKQSSILRGEGEGEAQRIYNEAYGQDPEFFDFWVSMNAMQVGMPANSTRFVGPPDSDFFKFFGDMNGGKQ